MRFPTKLFALAVLTCACSADDGGAASAATGEISSTDASATAADESLGGTGCEPGQPGCPCAGGMCLAPLICVEDECVWPPPDDSGNLPSTSTGDETSGDASTSAATCTVNDDCFEWEVCIDAACVRSETLAWQVYVPSWSPASCDGGPLDGVADVFWHLSVGNQLIYESTWQQGVCPGSWGPGAVGCVPAGLIGESWSLSLYDEDVDTVQLQDRLWWDGDENGVPDPLHPLYLHTGEYDDATGSGGHVRVEFSVVDGCE